MANESLIIRKLNSLNNKIIYKLINIVIEEDVGT